MFLPNVCFLKTKSQGFSQTNELLDNSCRGCCFPLLAFSIACCFWCVCCWFSSFKKRLLRAATTCYLCKRSRLQGPAFPFCSYIQGVICLQIILIQYSFNTVEVQKWPTNAAGHEHLHIQISKRLSFNSCSNRVGPQHRFWPETANHTQNWFASFSPFVVKDGPCLRKWYCTFWIRLFSQMHCIASWKNICIHLTLVLIRTLSTYV